MKLKNVCLLTENVRKLYSFYQKVMQVSIPLTSLEYVEIDLGGTNLSIYNVEAHNNLVDSVVDRVINTSSMIEIEVEDVDAEYERLCKMDIKWAKYPTTQPWGTRSIYFYDPDGNLINFFSVVKDE